MTIETVRINAQGREQLIRLKRTTKIENWNTLCRWAFCISLAEKTVPPNTIQKFEGGVEMSWKTFGGAQSDLYYALLKKRCLDDNIAPTIHNLSDQFRLHLHRGLAYLSTNKSISSVSDLVERAVKL
jgi:DNA sulfur modification protein DndE